MNKLIPETIGIFRNGKYVPNTPVVAVRTYPPGMAPVAAPIRKDLVCVEILTGYGPRWYGVKRAWITSALRMAVELADGCERDEVVAKWEQA